jgi:hypothetical protein
VETEPSVTEINGAEEDQHLAQEHRLKKTIAYVPCSPKTAAPPPRKGSAIRMERFRANKDAQGLVQAYVPADILGIAKKDDGGWESMRIAIGVGRRALALRGWRAKLVALLLSRT